MIFSASTGSRSKRHDSKNSSFIGMHLIYPQILVYPQNSPDLWMYSDRQKCSRTVIVFVKKTNILFFSTSFAQVIYRYLAPFKVPIASKKFFYHQEFSTRFCAERRSILAFLFADFVVIEPFIVFLDFLLPVLPLFLPQEKQLRKPIDVCCSKRFFMIIQLLISPKKGCNAFNSLKTTDLMDGF